MALDLSWILGSSEPSQSQNKPPDSQRQTTQASAQNKPKNTAGGSHTEQEMENSQVLLNDYQQEQAERERYRKAYKEYQDNIKAAGNVRADLISGVRAGEPVEDLLLKACKAISLMTGDKLFYDQIEKDITKDKQ